MLNKIQLNTIKNKLFDELKIISQENTRLRYTKCNVPVHKDAFEDPNSELGWYIHWGENFIERLDENSYEIRPMRGVKRDNSTVHKEMLKVLDYPKFPSDELSNSVAAVITDINNNVILSARNLKSKGVKNSTTSHAEQLLLSELKNVDIPIRKLKIYVTLIPCIDCFKKIYENKYVDEIIYLKDYRSTLVLTQHRNWIKSIDQNKRVNYLMSTESLKTPESRRVCYHHDAYLIQQRVFDIFDKAWFKELDDDENLIEISKLNYNDFEKLTLLMKYVSKEVLSLSDDISGRAITINKNKFISSVKKMKKIYKGKGKDNNLVNHLESSDITIRKH